MKKTPLEDWIVNRTGIAAGNQTELEAYQLKKILETINYARKNSAFYKNHLAAIGPGTINSLADLKNIPFTDGEELQKAPYSFVCVPQQKIDRIVTLNTSGTNGERKRLFFTDQDLERTVDFFNYGMRSLIDRSDRVLVLLPGNTYGSIGELLKKALTLSGVPCTVFGLLTDLDEVEKTIEANQITCIVGIPIQVLYLSRMKSDVFKRRIRKLLLSTDYVPAAMVDELHRKFNCQVFTHYGMTEMGYGGGVECEAQNGYHLREADLYVEIVDPYSGAPVENGEYGEVVFTSLTREAMPLIRYRTGDIAAFSVESCPCGTFLRTLKKVEGRFNNRIKLGDDVFLELKRLDEMILRFEEIVDYQAVLEDDNHLNIEIALYDESHDARIKEQLSTMIQEYIKNSFSITLEVNVSANQEKKPNQLKNSMFKRKIYDMRKERRNE